MSGHRQQAIWAVRVGHLGLRICPGEGRRLTIQPRLGDECLAVIVGSGEWAIQIVATGHSEEELRARGDQGPERGSWLLPMLGQLKE